MTSLLLLGTLLFGATASADPLQAGLSSVEIEEDRFTITIAKDEFADRIPLDNLDAADRLLAALTVDTTWISVDGRACRVGNAQMAVQEDGVALSAPILCNKGETWRYHATWLRGRDKEHSHVVNAFGERIGVLTPDSTSIELVPQTTVTSDLSVPGSAWVVVAAAAFGLLLLGGLLLFWFVRLGMRR